jgi:hypothetical protein
MPAFFQGGFGVVLAQFSLGIQIQPSGSSDRHTSDFSFFLAALVATIFGVIHVAAWRFLFPSTAELMIWHVCSLLVTLVPLVVLLMPLFVFCYNWRRAYFSGVLDKDSHTDGMDRVAKTARILICTSVYFAARIILLVPVFLCFRSMPADVCVTVEWLQYVPHIWNNRTTKDLHERGCGTALPCRDKLSKP